MKFLVTGGCGFIGSHLVHVLLYHGHKVVNLDKLTYAGNPENLADIASRDEYEFVQGDITDYDCVRPLIDDVDIVINTAAESHVDRSIDMADAFIKTNFYGVYTICEAIKDAGAKTRLMHVSTDEVYGSIDEGEFKEGDSFSPSSPYAASKAGGELLAFSYAATHGLDVVATRGANTYGPNQFPEKLIPYFVTQLMEGKKVPLYGDGANVRDWLYVIDHARAMLNVAVYGKSGEAYNVPGCNERTNIEVTQKILSLMGLGEESIEPVKDRPGHDRRYAVAGEKILELDYKQEVDFEKGIAETVEWYQKNEDWWRPLKDKSKEFFNRHYGALKKST